VKNVEAESHSETNGYLTKASNLELLSRMPKWAICLRVLPVIHEDIESFSKKKSNQIHTKTQLSLVPRTLVLFSPMKVFSDNEKTPTTSKGLH